MIARRRPDKIRTEAGFTLTELTIVIVITGIVIACISSALVMSMQVGPSVKGRSTFSVDGAFLVSSISDDVANARLVTPPTPGAITCTSGAWIDLGHLTLIDGTAVAYSAAVSASPAAVVDGTDVYQVDATRVAGGSTVALTAYCASGASLGSGASYSSPTYSLDLALRVSTGGEVRHITVSAATRIKLASAFTVSGHLYTDTNGNGVRDGADTALSGATWQVAVSNNSGSTLATINPDASGAFSWSAPSADSYTVCPAVPSNWAQTQPAGVGAAVVTCASGAFGWVVSPAYYTNLDFGTVFSGASCALLMTRTVDLSRAVGGPGTPGKPANYATVQAAYNAARVSAQAEVIGLFSNTTENDVFDGAKAMTITQCSGGGTITAASAASPTIKITNTQPLTIVSPATIGGQYGWELVTGGHTLKSIRATNAVGAGVKIDSTSNNNPTINWNSVSNNGGVGVDVYGSGNTLTGGSSGITSNAGGGMHFAVGANNNSLTGGTIASNTGYGVLVESTGNTISPENVSSNTTYGVRFMLTATGNTLSGATLDSNGSDGIFVEGANNTLTGNSADKNTGGGFNIANTATGTKVGSNVSNSGVSGGPKENTGAEYRFGTAAGTDQTENKANNKSVPAAGMCPTFPAASSVCE